MKRSFSRRAPIDQAVFKGGGWSETRWHDQVEGLARQLPGLAVDEKHLMLRGTVPIPRRCVRVVVPKLAFLGKAWGIDCPYVRIGRMAESVCGMLADRYGDQFENRFGDELAGDRLRCASEAAARRRSREDSVPGDLLVLDVDLGNATLGDSALCHNQEWNRNAIAYRRQLSELSLVDLAWIVLLNLVQMAPGDEPTALRDFSSPSEEPVLAFDATLEQVFVANSWNHSPCFQVRFGLLSLGSRLDSLAIANHAPALAVGR